MPIHFISGKPGSGKSLYAVHLVIKELLEGHRNIVTNLPLHVGRLNEYLQSIRPTQDVGLAQRLRVLSEDEARTFWKYRGTKEPYGVDLLQDNRSVPAGVMFVLDELHLFFNARDWMQTGRDCLHYLSQHRKLGDVVLAITQSVPNVDKQFRSVSEDFTVLRNEYTAKYGPFRGRGRFVRKTYLSEPTGTGKQEPFETASFTLDAAGIASCYDTAQGIGIHGTAADKGRKAKGWSIWWVIPLGFGVASLAGVIPWLMSKGAASIVTGSAVEEIKAKSPSLTFPISNVKEPNHATNRPQALSLPGISNSQSVWVAGYVAQGARINVTLTDGRTITEKDGTLAKVERNFVEMVDGSRYWLKPAVSVGAGVKLTPDRQDSVLPVEVFTDASSQIGKMGKELDSTPHLSQTDTQPHIKNLNFDNDLQRKKNL